MAAKVSHQHIEVLLQELDGTTTVLGQIDQTQSLGPFGVFSTQPTPSLATDSPTSVQVDGIYPEHIIDDDDSLHVDFRAVPAGLEEQQLINFNLFHSGPFTPLLEDHLDPLFDTAVTGNYDFDALVELVEYEGQSPGNATMEIMRSPSPRSLSLPLHFAGDIGDLAPLITNTLLAHYRETLIANFIPLKQHKPPWTILHLPCAMSAYGEIALLGDTNNAKASLLFAIFAMSALNLDQHQKRDTGKSSQWLAAGELYRERAKCRLQACLREQGGNVKKAKYKEVLMALLSMVTTCVSYAANAVVSHILLYRFHPPVVTAFPKSATHSVVIFYSPFEPQCICPFRRSQVHSSCSNPSSGQFPAVLLQTPEPSFNHLQMLTLLAGRHRQNGRSQILPPRC